MAIEVQQFYPAPVKNCYLSKYDSMLVEGVAVCRDSGDGVGDIAIRSRTLV